MKVHELKIWPEHFAPVVSGLKRFEVRFDDRGYQAGDRLRLREWDPEAKSYTGAECWRDVTIVVAVPAIDNLVGLGITETAAVEAVLQLERVDMWREEAARALHVAELEVARVGQQLTRADDDLAKARDEHSDASIGWRKAYSALCVAIEVGR